jgi:hypothetical protein
LGRAACHSLYRWVPTLALGFVFFHIRLSDNLVAWLTFAFRALFAIVLSPIRDLSLEKPNIEGVVRQIYEGSL